MKPDKELETAKAIISRLEESIVYLEFLADEAKKKANITEIDKLDEEIEDAKKSLIDLKIKIDSYNKD